MNARAVMGENISNNGGMSRLDISNISFDTKEENSRQVHETSVLQPEQRLNLSSLRAAVAKKNVSPDFRSDNSQNVTVIKHDGERTGGFGTTNTTIINFPQESNENISVLDETTSMVAHSEFEDSVHGGSPKRKTRAMRLKKKAHEISASKTNTVMIGKKPSN